MSEQQSSHMHSVSDEFYHRMLATVPVAMLATDARDRIIYWNDAARRLLRMDPDALSGRDLHDLIPPKYHKLLDKLLRRTMKQRRTTRIDVRVTRSAGRTQDLAFLLSPIEREGQEGGRVAICILDETSRGELSDKLHRTEKLAALGTLAGGVAHHFNNILGGVATFVDFALTSGDEAAMKRALQMSSEAAARASSITKSLLSFARKEPHRGDLADLTEVVMTFAHLVERPLSEHNIKLEVGLRPVPVIAVEAAQMNRALRCLLSNAEDALPDGGTISLGIDGTEDEVALTFADTGSGIAPEDLPQIFEPFFTTKGTLRGGTEPKAGLGLSVAHGIITEMGGRIDVQSQPGTGTQVRISFDVPAKGDD